MTFRMYAKIRMNRPVNPDSDYISPGGYMIKSNSEEYSFDFEEYECSIDEKDRSIVHAYTKNPDRDSFPDIEKITADTLRNISEFTEFFVYTENINGGKSDLHAVELLECQFRIIDAETDEDITLSETVCRKSVVR